MPIVMTRPYRLLLGSDLTLTLTLTLTPPNGNTTGGHYDVGGASFDSNMVIILAALLCALLCVLGLNSIVRCVLRCSHRTTDAVAVQFASGSLKKEGCRRIPVAAYKPGVDFRGSECPICLGEMVQGEDVGIFPRCNHVFHVNCIERWLVSYSSCPTCRQPLMENSDHTEHVRVEIR